MNVLSSAVMSSLVVLGLPAFADETTTLESITVTAQRYEQNLQDVPIAITAIDGKELRRNGITTAGEVLGTTPSITIAPYVNSTNTFFLYMRGLGFIDPGQIGTDGAVGLYQDGFYISRPQGINVDLSDIERVEVLRGPQGTLYGRNTMGGAVNFISNVPSGEADYRQDLELGNLHYYRALSIVDLPAWNSLSAKVSLLARSIGGSIEDPDYTRGFGADSQQGGKLQLRWAPEGAFRADYFLDYVSIESTPNYAVNTAFNGYTIIPGIPYVASTQRPDAAYRSIDIPQSYTRSSLQGLTLNWVANPDLTLRSLSGYRWLYADTYQNYNEIYGLPNFSTQNVIPDYQFSQELQAIGQIPSAALTFVAGLYHFNENTWNHLYGSAAGLGVYSMVDENESSRSNAVYGQTTWTANSRLELTIGGRYTHDSKHGVRTSINLLSNQAEYGAQSNVHYGRFTPEGTARLRLSQDASIYLRAASGYKSGAPNANAPIGGFSQVYGPESLVTYELGLKSLWFEQRSRLNVALFQTNYKDQQRAIQLAPTVFAYEAFNIGRETLRGAEVELTANPTPDLSMSLNYAYLDGHIDELNAPAHTIFDPAVNPYSPYHVGDDISGLFDPSQGYGPRNSVYGTIDYAVLHLASGDIYTNLNYRWQGKRAEVGPDVPGSEYAVAPAFGWLGASIAYRPNMANGHRLRISLWGRSLLNNKSALWVNGYGSIVRVSPAPAGYTGSIIVGWQQPLEFGISATYEL